jgi:hypothetical protein
MDTKRPKRYAIQIVDQGNVQMSSGARPPGQYIKSFDPEAYDGRGDAEGTFDKREALTFTTGEDALNFWRQQSKTRPLREDGRPNRPLTAFTVEIVEV